ncbi:MAG: glutamate racemase [Oscillospiraceae bacterium]|jgi:glutamate racemase
MDNRAIGIFDSGLGGLTAAEVVAKELPNETIIYFGDTGRMPYGGKSRGELLKMARQNIEFLSQFDVKLVLSACGTISSTVLPVVAEQVSIPVIGVLNPTIEEAVAATRNKRIGIIATQATIDSDAFGRGVRARLPEAQVTSVACPKLVPLIETGHTESTDPELWAALTEYLTIIQKADVDTLILGCTHYPLLWESISSWLGRDVTLISSGAAAAHALRAYLYTHALLAEENRQGNGLYYTSGSAKAFATAASILFDRELPGEVREIVPFAL